MICYCRSQSHGQKTNLGLDTRGRGEEEEEDEKQSQSFPRRVLSEEEEDKEDDDALSHDDALSGSTLRRTPPQATLLLGRGMTWIGLSQCKKPWTGHMYQSRRGCKR